jgi:hypothetical protein
MKQFEDFFSDDDIIFYLARVRSKFARRRNKKHLLNYLTKNKGYNYHLYERNNASERDEEFMKELTSLMPPRRLWKKLGESARFRDLDGSKRKLGTLDRNVLSLAQVRQSKRKNVDSVRKRAKRCKSLHYNLSFISSLVGGLRLSFWSRMARCCSGFETQRSLISVPVRV